MRPWRRRSRLVCALGLALVAGCTSSKVEPKPEKAAEPEAPAVAAPPAPAPAPAPEQPKTRHRPRPATIAVSSDHVCAIEGKGAVACWGAGREGQLGPDIREHRAAPARVPGIDDAIAVFVGDDAGCALRAEGSLTCWGDGGAVAGARGASFTSRALGDVVELAMVPVGRAGVCARRGDGTVACASLAELAAGRVHAIAGLGDAVGLEFHSTRLYVLRSTGALEWYELEPGTMKPGGGTRDEALGEVVDLARVESTLCVALASGEVRCRGYPAEWRSEVPTAGPLWKSKLPGELWATSVDDAGSRALRCIRDVAGQVACWGDNRYGQLGLGKPAYSSAPVPLLDRPMVTFDAGGDVTCGADADGKLACRMDDPLDVEGDEEGERPEGVSVLAVGPAHSCAIVGGGEARCWGFSPTGALGVPGLESGLARVGSLSDLSAIAVADDHSCAARRDHSVRCWGLGDEGQLGDGRFGDGGELDGDGSNGDDPMVTSAEPLLVEGVTGDVVGLALGSTFSCAGTTVGLYCWGSMPEPDGLEDIRLAQPTVVLAGPVLSVAAEGSSLCAVTTGGAVHCGGPVAGRYRGGGDIKRARDEQGERAPIAEMRRIGIEATAVAVGGEHACLLSGTGKVSCWGSNAEGQLGDGTTRDRAVPVAVKGLPGPAVQIAAGDGHTCARVADGTIHCWGSRTGPREFSHSRKPRPVGGLAPHVSAEAPPPVATPAPPGADQPAGR